MFKHILIPTDGSPVAGKAVKAGLELAKALGAKVTGYYAIEPIQPQMFGEGYIIGKGSMEEFERGARKVADKHMAAMAKAAAVAGVEFTPLVTKAETP